MTDTDKTKLEQEADADLDAGFEAEEPAPKALETKPQQQQAKPPETKPVATPKFVQLTQEQFANLEAAAKKVTDMEGQMSKLFGTLGNMQESVKKLSSAGPRQVSAELLTEAYADMAKEFPELANHNISAMRKVLEKVQLAVGGTAEAVDPKAVQKAVTDAAVSFQVEALTDAHPDWREIVGPVDSEGRHDARNPFRVWLAKQPAGYQHKVNSTNSAAVISRAIDLFKKAIAKPPAPPAKPLSPQQKRRAATLRGAVQPRGDGRVPTPTTSKDDDFESGFAGEA